MPTKILELELNQWTQNDPEIKLDGYAKARILVRRSSEPLGYIVLGKADLHKLPQEIQYYLDTPPSADPFYLPEANLPLVTVVVCTRNRPTSLQKCLASLRELKYPNLEILIVDNAPSDEQTKLLVAQFPDFKYACEARPGLDWARNRGIREATGEIIAYTDDDVRVDQYWVHGLVQAFERPEVMAVTGLVAPAELETEAQEYFELYGGFGRGFKAEYYLEAEQKQWYYFPLNAGRFGTGANMAYRRRFFEKFGKFDPALDVGTPTHGGGDLDMFYRVLRSGHALVYQPKALVWHYHRRDLPKLKGQLYDFGRAYFAFLTKCFITDPAKRLTILRWLLEWLVRWYAKRLIRPRGLPRLLIFYEAFGSLSGTLCYFISLRHSKRLANIKANK
jgi:O-antigen biosynthesis protein